MTTVDGPFDEPIPAERLGMSPGELALLRARGEEAQDAIRPLTAGEWREAVLTALEDATASDDS